MCGTPNYIAPEILNKVGHSYEVDIWSIGCIMYTLLVGKPPFETSSLKETYARIKQVQYRTPSSVSRPAISMISSMLQGNPSKRPSVDALMRDPFFASGIIILIGYLIPLMNFQCFLQDIYLRAYQYPVLRWHHD